MTESVDELDIEADSDANAPSEGEASPDLDADPEGERSRSSILGSRVCVINLRAQYARQFSGCGDQKAKYPLDVCPAQG
jgi:hypothetical protein